MAAGYERELGGDAENYDATLSTLVSFNQSNGSGPYGVLIAANGDLVGTTAGGGAYNYGGGAYGNGTAYQIAKTPTGYASTPTTLFSFDGNNGAPGKQPDR